MGSHPRSPADSERIQELYLIVRPEEKYDLELALRGVIAPFYSTMNALGRGSQGGLFYERPSRWRSLVGAMPPRGASFLPKTVFHLVVPERLVASIVRVARAALDSKGGPDDRGLGVAIVADVESEIAIDGRSATSRTADVESVSEEIA